MGLEPTISCLGSKRSTTELHPLGGDHYKVFKLLWQVLRDHRPAAPLSCRESKSLLAAPPPKSNLTSQLFKKPG